MSELSKLRQEHAQLVEIVRRLGRIIALATSPAQTELVKLRTELTSTLIQHLKAEDWVLYPRLLNSANRDVAQTARKFSAEMGGLAKAYSAYAEKWGADAIHQDWPGYCADTRGSSEALTLR